MFQPETSPLSVIQDGWAMWMGSFSWVGSVMTTTPGLVCGLKSLATLPVNVMGAAATVRAPSNATAIRLQRSTIRLTMTRLLPRERHSPHSLPNGGNDFDGHDHATPVAKSPKRYQPAFPCLVWPASCFTPPGHSERR